MKLLQAVKSPWLRIGDNIVANLLILHHRLSENRHAKLSEVVDRDDLVDYSKAHTPTS